MDDTLKIIMNIYRIFIANIYGFYSVNGWWEFQPKYQWFTKSKIVFSNLIACISF